jgi:hypothetical protein
MPWVKKGGEKKKRRPETLERDFSQGYYFQPPFNLSLTLGFSKSNLGLKKGS